MSKNKEKKKSVVKTANKNSAITEKKKFRAKPYREYDEEVKLAAVKAVQEGRTAQEVSRIFGVGHTTVCEWVDFYASGSRKKRKSMKWQRVDMSKKLAAVEEVKRGRGVPEVAEEFEVTKSALYKWVTKFAPDSKTLIHKPDLEKIQERMEKLNGEKGRAEAERVAAAEEEKASVEQMVAHPLTWMQKYTETKDSHWRERGARTPYRPFPEKPYFRPAIEDWQREPVVFIEKSRNMMLTWLTVGFFTHAAMTTPGIEVLFQSQKEDKAFELVDYARILYERQRPELKRAFPLVKKSDGELLFANGSRIVGIPGGADQIRSYHPWGLLMDEAAFMPEAGESYNNAVPVCKKMLMLSSAGPGWFADICNSGAAISTQPATADLRQSAHGTPGSSTIS